MLDVNAVRRDFPIFAANERDGRSLVYLDSAASAQKPQVVIDREAEVYSRFYANAYRGVYSLGAQIDEAIEESRESVRQLIGAASSDEIVLTSGTTMSINLVALGWARKYLKPGDQILLNRLEHHANIVPWQMAAAATGATITWVPLTRDGRVDLAELDELLTPRTRLVAITGMSNVLGTIPPLREIVTRAHQAGALVLVDGAQSVPHGPVDVIRDEIDFLTFSGHKLYGPTGIGILYARSELLKSMDPAFGGGHMIDQVFTDRSTWAAPPARFEAGTLPIAQAISLKSAVDYVQSLGWDAIHQHETTLLRRAHEALSNVPGLRILGPDVAHKGAIVSFVLEGAASQDVAMLLDRKRICVRHGHHCAMPLHEWLGISASVRASFAIYNTPEEIDQLVDGLHYVRGRLRLD
jgi:cysteine desulfurase/selenocysteine lyase